jgi:hypothetical protein
MSAISNMRSRMHEAKKNLMPGPRVKELQQIKHELSVYQDHLDDVLKSENDKIDKSVEAMKPEQPFIYPHERKERPGIFVMNNRKIDQSDITRLDYLAKRVLSRIHAEASTTGDYLSIIEELATSDDLDMKYVLLDNFHLLTKAGERLEGFDSVKYRLMDFHKEAKNAVRTPEEVAYDDALAEAGSRKHKVQVEHIAHTKNVQEFSVELEKEIRELSDLHGVS